MRNLNLLRLVFCSIALSTPLIAADWPQWRGPDRTDRSSETNLLTSWPNEGPKRIWLFDKAGLGYSGYSIVGDRLFTMGARGNDDGTEQLIAVDTKKGTELWSADVGSTLDNGWGDGPRATPTVDGDRVYAMGGKGGLICADVKTGRIHWRASMTDLGGKIPTWGYCESVLVDGDQLICTPGGSKGAVAALAKKTGKVIWRSTDFTDGAQYSSVIAIEHNKKRQYVQLTMQSLVGLDAKNGELLWRSDWPGQTAVIPTPIYHDGHVYVSSGYGVGCKLVRLEKNDAADVYSNKVMKNHHGGVIRVGGHLYGYSDRAGWTCQDFMTGKRVWSEKKKLGKGCLTFADGHLYCVDENDGTVVLAEASHEGWNEKGRFKLSPQTKRRKPSGRVWTHPVVANGRLYLRDQEYIYCYDVSAK